MEMSLKTNFKTCFGCSAVMRAQHINKNGDEADTTPATQQTQENQLQSNKLQNNL